MQEKESDEWGDLIEIWNDLVANHKIGDEIEFAEIVDDGVHDEKERTQSKD